MKYVCCSIVVDDCGPNTEATQLEALLNCEISGELIAREKRHIRVVDGYYPHQKIIMVDNPKDVPKVHDYLEKNFF